MNPQESRLLARLRKHQKDWLVVRWWTLASGMVSCALFGFLLYWGISEVLQPLDPGLTRLADESKTALTADRLAAMVSLLQEKEEHDLLIGSVLIPFSLLMMAAGIQMLTIAERDWHGNLEQTLILRLFESCQSAETRNNKS